MREWLKGHKVYIEDLPLYLPDLSPINPCWWLSKVKLFKLYP